MGLSTFELHESRLMEQYDCGQFYDEMINDANIVRSAYKRFVEHFGKFTAEDIIQRQYAAERAFVTMGITFNVYSEGSGTERIFPFDIIPRIINGHEWDHIDRGLRQRITALNLFLQDIYGEQKILRDNVIPEEIVLASPGYLPQCRGVRPPKDIWCHIGGIDIIKHTDGSYYVLEDNLRVPSGVAYMLGNRHILKRTFPEIFTELKVRPISNYPLMLRDMLQHLSPAENPEIVVMTPGIYNSAYFEHSFLAQQMGVQLVEGRDMVVKNDKAYMRTTRGLQRVDVIYRRVDDTFLDPRSFNPDSVLGVPGLFSAYIKGNVALANAPGTGVADDKVIYAYVPEIIRYYLNEDAILQNVPTYICCDPFQREYVLSHLDQMVVKTANQAGGYGMLIGPAATSKELAEFKQNILDDPRDYIAQPVMALSTVPTCLDNICQPRHVDLRPYVLYGDDIHIVPGGLTRVALRKGSLVVNSSQGGGSKDTWVLQDN